MRLGLVCRLQTAFEGKKIEFDIRLGDALVVLL